MLKAFIEKIEEMAKANVISITGRGNRSFSDKPIWPVIDPVATPLYIHTITGLVSFLETLTAETTRIIQIRDYNEVQLVSNLFGPEKQRECFIVAQAHSVSHQFERYLPVDRFIVYLQSCFVQDDNTENIMRVVGNITQGAESTFEDDGVTQRVTAKAGVARVETIPVPNPVTLRPFRTFPDITQPDSLFVLRVKAGQDEAPRCALFEADGGAWKNKAIQSIKEFLKNATEQQITISA